MGLSPKVFAEFVRPYDERLIRIAKGAGKLVLYHDCGRCDALLETFVEMGIDYLESLNPRSASGDVDPAEAKRRIGHQVCLRGGFNHQILSFGTVEEVRQEVRYCLDTLSPGNGYILCPAGPLDADVRMENLEAFAEAARDLCSAYASQ
jgi:uroporphyrinogen decarboxylase